MKEIIVEQRGQYIEAIKGNKIIGQCSVNDGASSVAISIFNLLKELEKDLLEDLNVKLKLE